MSPLKSIKRKPAIGDNYEKNPKDGQRDIWCGGKNGGGSFSYGISLVP
jgi:hypothetical protein